jgi:hypothetical protein
METAMDQDERNRRYYERQAIGVEKMPNGETQGLDPRKMPTILLEKIGHKKSPLLRIIQAKCLDCSHSASEVRKCTAVDCALWPYRMGENPFKPERSEAQREADRLAGERLRAMRRDPDAE